MSAIAGIVSLDGTIVEPGMIERLTGPMAARGPDGAAHWTGGNVTLGHCMLHSTPESVTEQQPLLSDDGKITLVFDGRLDNREELAGLLGLRTSELNTLPDAAIVLKAYQRWYSDCPGRLFGDFSLALWDERRQQLFCSRDTVGARQFYYVHNKRFFAFASDDEVLTRLPGISSEPYGELIAHLMVSAFMDLKPRQTWFRDVRLLSPAHSLCVKPGGELRFERYWHFEQGKETGYGSDEECEEAFLDVFGAAVRSRLRLLGEPAMMVSGGMDSAGIAAMLGRQITHCPGNRYHAYSAVADDLHSSLESRCIMSMTGHGYVTPHRVGMPSVTGAIGLKDLEQVAWTRADPVDNAILLPAMMCLAASRNGHRVMLHGASGDITMGVFNRYIAPLLRTLQWGAAWRECGDASRHNTYLKHLDPSQILLRNVWTAFVPPVLRRPINRLRQGAFRAPPQMKLLNPAFARDLDLPDRLRAQSSPPVLSGWQEMRERHASLVFGRTGVVSAISAFQRMGSRYGVEMRDPWADRRVLEFFLHLPLNQLVRNGWTKYLARSAFAPDLDGSVRWRSDKEHLGWMFTDRLMRESRALIDRSMKHDLAMIEDYIDLEQARQCHARYTSSNNPDDRELLYKILTLTHWVKRLSDRAKTKPGPPAPGSPAGA